MRNTKFIQAFQRLNFTTKFYSSNVKPYFNIMAENNYPFLEQNWLTISRDITKPAMLEGYCTLSNIIQFMEDALRKSEMNPSQTRKEGFIPFEEEFYKIVPFSWSNVGKSSLINSLLGQNLANVSNYPGKTRALLFYKIASPKQGLILVDAPGYGFAKRDPKELEKWGKLMNTYISESPFLHRVFVLIDAEHGFKEVDHMLMDMLDKKKKPFIIVLTKCDKIGDAKLVEWYKKVDEVYKKFELFSPVLHSTSTKKDWGVNELRANIAYTLQMEILTKPN